jgi:hypothetical protein
MSQFFGHVVLSVQRFDECNPTQPVKALFGRFKDPDGHEHYLVKETARLPRV